MDKNVKGTKPFTDLGGFVVVDPLIPSFIPGYDLKGVEYIRKSYNYIKTLKKKIDGARDIGLVGGGCIGAEVAGQLAFHPDKTTGEIINIIGMAIQKNVTVYELVSYQIGTHPLLTSAPTKRVLIKAA